MTLLPLRWMASGMGETAALEITGSEGEANFQIVYQDGRADVGILAETVGRDRDGRFGHPWR